MARHQINLGMDVKIEIIGDPRRDRVFFTSRILLYAVIYSPNPLNLPIPQIGKQKKISGHKIQINRPRDVDIVRRSTGRFPFDGEPAAGRTTPKNLKTPILSLRSKKMDTTIPVE